MHQSLDPRLPRRTLLKGSAALAGGALLARPLGVLAQPLDNDDAYGTSRLSRLRDPAEGWRLVHADLHNHSHLSDGAGDPARAFPSMRDAGLDIACLTDHATLSWSPEGTPGASVCAPVGLVAQAPGLDQLPLDGCSALAGIDNAGWELTGTLAAQATVTAEQAAAGEGREFLAVRGFEWSSPTLGHMNCWFTQHWIDPLRTLGISGGAQLQDLLHPGVEALGPLGQALDGLLDGLLDPEAVATMGGWQRWLAAPADRPVLGGGRDGLAGFNHPGREVGRFGQFRHDPALQDLVVSMEIINRDEDYLFEGTDAGRPSPLVQCLAAGWTVGLIGVTDEHGTDWGVPEGKGRAGMWVRALDAAGMKEAMLGRQVFATRIKGLRLDATANGVPMGAQRLGHRDGAITFAVDLDHGPASWGTPVQIQVLTAPEDPAALLPRVLMTADAVVPRPTEPVITFTLPAVDQADVPWLVLRITGPERPGYGPDPRADGTPFGDVGAAWAYTSPWYTDPQAPPPDPAVPPGGGPDGPDGPRAVVTRLAGSGRAATAAEVSRQTFVAGVPTAFVAAEGSFADALAATSAAAAGEGPLLLTARSALPAPTRAELERLQPAVIVVLGGTAAVSESVEVALRPFAGSGEVRRLAGADRYGTAAAISADTFAGTAEELWIATGEGFADALAGGAAAARRAAPLLTTAADALPAPVEAEIRRLQPQRIVVLGGPSAVSDRVVAQLADLAPSVSRLEGEDRYATAAAVSAAAFPAADEVVVASGEDFPDALAAAPAAYLRMAPVLLVTRDEVPAATRAELERLAPARITIVGGTAAVSEAVEADLARTASRSSRSGR